MQKSIIFIWLSLLFLSACHQNQISKEETKIMKIKVQSDQHTVIFQLNNSSAALSLYQQLPLTIEVENYGDNEKIFYPPQKLDTSDVQESDGPAGSLAYFSPWGDVVMFYGSYRRYSGLYELGHAILGSEHIKDFKGILKISRDDNEEDKKC